MILNSPTISGSLTVTGNIITSGSITLSGSVASASFAATASFVALAQSASNAVAAETASFVALAQSASNAVSAATASFANAFTVASTLTAQTLVVQTITSSVDFVTGSTRFGSILGNTHVFSGSVTMNPGGLFVSSSGTVGIGTTSNTAKLEIQNSPANDWGISVWGNSTVSQSYGGIVRGGTNSSDVAFRVNNAANSSTYFTVQGNGNVGIGTTIPSGLLQVGVANSGIYFDVSTQYTPKIIAAGTISDIQIQSVGNGGNVYLNAPGTTSLINFQVNGAERMRINSGGEIGIGVTANAWRNTFKVLQVGTAALSTNANAFGYLSANFYNDTSGTDKYITSGKAGILSISNGEIIFYNTDTSGTANATLSVTEKMRISSVGDVFINHPTNIGEGKLRISQDSSLWNVEVRHTYATQYFMLFRYNASGIGSIQGNGSNVSYYTTSDYRLKEDLKEVNGLEKIAAIKVYNFKWKNNNLRMDGVLAHELSNVLPYAVTGDKDALDKDGNINPQGVDYSKLVPVLVKAIQELKTQNDALQSRIETLESK
jgi:hypothetical protein